MSKRELKKYLIGLRKNQLEEQVMDLYDRFKEVKTYYDFVFNPKEDKLLEACKFKISKEYFPLNSRKPKARRSVAQKYIKQFKTLGVDPVIIADVMLYNIEIAQAFAADKAIKHDAFFLSILKSYQEALNFIWDNGLLMQNLSRLERIVDQVTEQQWFNRSVFENELRNKIDLT